MNDDPNRYRTYRTPRLLYDAYTNTYRTQEDFAVAAADAILWESEDQPELAPTLEQRLAWDSSTGVIRPRLILLNAYLQCLYETKSEGEEWSRTFCEDFCDDEWATEILVKAGANPEQARAYVTTEWK